MMIATNESPLSNDTLSRVLDGAERCLFVHGCKGASIRRIAQEAGSSIASINYHFGSKKALFGALIQRRMKAVTRRRGDSLQSIEQGTECSIEDIVRAYIGAWFQIRLSVGQEVVEVIWSLLIGDPEVFRLSGRPVDDGYITVRRRYAQLLASVTSAVPVEELERRLEILERFALYVMAVPNACRTLASPGSQEAGAMQPCASLSTGLVTLIRACIQAPLAIPTGYPNSAGAGG